MHKKYLKIPSVVGFLQALGVLVYIGLVANFIRFMGNSNFPEGGVINIMLVLTLLVFSAAVTGSLVFGYPAILMVDKNSKQAWQILGYTLLFLLLMVVLIFTVIVLIRFNF